MLGILCNTASIFIGGIIGSLMRKRFTTVKGFVQMLGIGIMFMSVVNVISNTIVIKNNTLITSNIILIIFALLIGNLIGEKFKLDEKLAEIPGKQSKSGFIIATMMFSIGGLQIIGPICSVVNGDNSVLISKSLVDFPLAVSLGAILGAGVSLSSILVGIIQVIIGFIAYFAKTFFTSTVVSQLSTMGYIILFFIGFNMIFKDIIRIKTNNMIPSIGLIVIYNIIVNFVGA